jgi:polyisoprenoid-binding protein YceI
MASVLHHANVSASTWLEGTIMEQAVQNAVAWKVDPAHTGIEFSVKHFFTPVRGRYEEYEIELAYDEAHPENSSVKARIDVGSINTRNEQRDEHLQSGDFFAADEYPHITFESTSVRAADDGKLVARGPLRIKDQEHEVELSIQVLGVKDVPEEMREALGGIQQAASFHAELTVNRNDYDVGVGSWAAAAVVGREVKIEIALEANR